jgi:hypothetical protein
MTPGQHTALYTAIGRFPGNIIFESPYRYICAASSEWMHDCLLPATVGETYTINPAQQATEAAQAVP